MNNAFINRTCQINARPQTSSVHNQNASILMGLWPIGNRCQTPKGLSAMLRLKSRAMLLSNESKLASEECFSIALWRTTFHASQSSQPKKGFGIEPLLRPLAPEMGHQEIDFSR